MKAISKIRLANTITVGNQEQSYLKDDRYDLHLVDGTIVSVRCKNTGDRVMTSLHNTIWFTVKEPMPSKSKSSEAL